MSLLNGAISSGGSVNNANSYSFTDASSARAWSEAMATKAYERQVALQQMAQDFNAQEAQKARDWETEMANTIYTRSAKNMKEAGINPILAYNNGLSGAGVSSGATASIGAGSAPMAQNFMDSQSASQSNGKSWNSSESGLVTGLKMLGDALGGAIDKISSGMNLNFSLEGLKDFINNETPINDVVNWLDKRFNQDNPTHTRGTHTSGNSGRTHGGASGYYGGVHHYKSIKDIP